VASAPHALDQLLGQQEILRRVELLSVLAPQTTTWTQIVPANNAQEEVPGQRETSLRAMLPPVMPQCAERISIWRISPPTSALTARRTDLESLEIVHLSCQLIKIAKGDALQISTNQIEPVSHALRDPLLVPEVTQPLVEMDLRAQLAPRITTYPVVSAQLALQDLLGQREILTLVVTPPALLLSVQ